MDKPGLAPVPPIARGPWAPGRQPGRPGVRPRAPAASRRPRLGSCSPLAVTATSFTVGV